MKNRAMSHTDKAQRGVTLIELIVTIAILAIMVAIGFGGYQSMTIRNQLATHANLFLASLHRTRAEAVERQARVTMCIPKSASVRECDSTKSDWTAGWIIFVDDDRDGTMNDADDLIFDGGALLGSTTLQTQGTDYAYYVSFTQSGVTRGLSADSSSLESGTLALCDQKGSVGEHRIVTIRRSGSPSISRVEASCPL